MAVNQTKIFDQLKQLTNNPDSTEFVYGFMKAYDFAKAAITKIRNGNSYNAAKVAGHVAIKNKFYYQPVNDGDDIDDVFNERLADAILVKNKIRFVIMTDCVRFLAWDTLTKERLDIEFDELSSHYGFFLPLVGLEKAILYTDHPADVKAAEKMGQLFDIIKVRNDLTKKEDVHALNVFLTRILFCFFAEDTGIFEKDQFTSAVKSYTEEDGSNVDQFLTDLFSVMNSELDSKLRQTLPVHLTAFPYVNGGLFKADEPIPEFGKKGRRLLIECGSLDWSEINPDIFGSMFQAVIDVKQRSQLGQHYTSYSNIMKVIYPLFLDPLLDELEKRRNSVEGLKKLLVRMGKIKVFDPACGSGNFLIIAYKELRKLEIEVVRALQECDPQSMMMSGIGLGQFYGIEIDDFACEIARLSLWLAEHQQNTVWEKEFGYAPPALPLGESGHITCGNSLRLAWEDVCPKENEDEVYVIGNPPFLGTLGRSPEQRQDMKDVFFGFKSLGKLDFVACWFWKGAQYIRNSRAELALVSTNSLCQGEQVATLWPPIFELGLNIHFAYPSFKWTNGARDNAKVHVIIVGLSGQATPRQLYQQIEGEWHCKQVTGISPYLIEGGNTAVKAGRKSLVKNIPSLVLGNMPFDGGHLFLDWHEREKLLAVEPQAKKWVKKVLGGEEFLHAKQRWCLWLVGITDKELRAMPHVFSRVQRVAEIRKKSPDKGTQKLADRPHQFRDLNNPDSYILIPRTSSGQRTYVPMGFFGSNVISTDNNHIMPKGTLYEFGILSSLMHNEWMRLLCGRLGGSYRYSSTLIYNSFPWPEVNEDQRQEVMVLAKNILFIQARAVDKTLAELYDPDKMPADLLEAHQQLDRSVERLYREKPFKDTDERLSFLLARYEKLVNT